MLDRSASKKDDPAPVLPLSPQALLSALHIAEPPVPICVEGTVESVRPHQPSRSSYLTLSGGGARIEARVPLEEEPHEKETVRITGMVTVRPSRLGAGLNVIIYGHLENAVPRPVRQHVALQKVRRVSLEALLDGKPMSSLFVIGTDRAFSDLSSTGLRELPRFQRVSTIAAPGLLEAAANAALSGAAGIVFARGGSNDSTEDLWDDAKFVAHLLEMSLPFYTAIGHSDGVHLADRYADQAFTTPTHVGTELCRIVDRRAAKVRSDAEIAHLRERVAVLERQGGDEATRERRFIELRWPSNRSEWIIALASLFVLFVLVARSLR